MKRPYLATWILLAVAAVALPSIAHARDRDRFHLVEATIAEIHDAFRSGALTPEELVRMYFARIAAYDQAGPQLNSFMHVNEHALSAARWRPAGPAPARASPCRRPPPRGGSAPSPRDRS